MSTVLNVTLHTKFSYFACDNM